MTLAGRVPREPRFSRGTCPVCRSAQRLLVESGKVGLHGRTAAAPRGCDGSYQRPFRVDAAGELVTGGTVVGLRSGEASATAREQPPPLRLDSQLDPPA